jgi:hypothetical protein
MTCNSQLSSAGCTRGCERLEKPSRGVEHGGHGIRIRVARLETRAGFDSGLRDRYDRTALLTASLGVEQAAVPVVTEPGGILIRSQREFCRTWANQTEVTVPGVHFVQEDSPDLIGAAVADFVRGIRGAGPTDGPDIQAR